jgi:hypothetical protein
MSVVEGFLLCSRGLDAVASIKAMIWLSICAGGAL